MRPREAANSALSGRARYWVRWNLLFSCCSCKDEYIVLGFRIFFPFPLRRKPPGSSFGSAVKKYTWKQIEKEHIKYRYYILNWQYRNMYVIYYFIIIHLSYFIPYFRKTLNIQHTYSIMTFGCTKTHSFFQDYSFIHNTKTFIQPLRFVFFECSIKFNKPERGRENLTLFFILNNI